MSPQRNALLACSLLMAFFILGSIYKRFDTAAKLVPSENRNELKNHDLDSFNSDEFRYTLSHPILADQSHEEFVLFCAKVMSILPNVDNNVQRGFDERAVELIYKEGRENFVRSIVSIIAKNQIDGLYISAGDEAPYFVALFKFQLLRADEVKKQLESLSELDIKTLSNSVNRCIRYSQKDAKHRLQTFEWNP